MFDLSQRKPAESTTGFFNCGMNKSNNNKQQTHILLSIIDQFFNFKGSDDLFLPACIFLFVNCVNQQIKQLERVMTKKGTNSTRTIEK